MRWLAQNSLSLKTGQFKAIILPMYFDELKHRQLSPRAAGITAVLEARGRLFGDCLLRNGF